MLLFASLILLFSNFYPMENVIEVNQQAQVLTSENFRALRCLESTMTIELKPLPEKLRTFLEQNIELKANSLIITNSSEILSEIQGFNIITPIKLQLKTEDDESCTVAITIQDIDDLCNDPNARTKLKISCVRKKNVKSSIVSTLVQWIKGISQ